MGNWRTILLGMFGVWPAAPSITLHMPKVEFVGNAQWLIRESVDPDLPADELELECLAVLAEPAISKCLAQIPVSNPESERWDNRFRPEAAQ